jgi:hypothetical protein
MRKASLSLVVLLLVASHGWTASKAEDLFKEAQLQETTARDLEAASRYYREFLQQAPKADRFLQAEAYLHLGICEYKIGRTGEAKVAWKKVVQDFTDQANPYSEALNQLQTAEAEERAAVHVSSPVVQVVYVAPPARWLIEFPRFTSLRTIDGKGRLVDTAAGGSIGFVHFPEPNCGVGMEFGDLGASGPPSARRDIAYFMILARFEKPIVNGFSFYMKGGPGTYFYRFSNSQRTDSKTNIGGSLEAGFTIGLSRGFAFNFGYLLHAFAQSTPPSGFIDTIPTADRANATDVTQNRGLRFVGGPDLSLSFRW